MKIVVPIVSLLQCDKNVNTLLALTQKKKETNKPSVTPRQDPGRLKSLSNQAKSQVWNNKLAFLTPHFCSFLQGQLQRPQLHHVHSCREYQHHLTTPDLHIQGAQATGLTDPLMLCILLHIQVVVHPTGLQLPPVSHLSGLRKRSKVHRVTVTYRYLWTQLDIHSFHTSQATQRWQGIDKFTSISQTNKTKALATMNWKMMLIEISTASQAASTCWGPEQPKRNNS